MSVNTMPLDFNKTPFETIDRHDGSLVLEVLTPILGIEFITALEDLLSSEQIKSTQSITIDFSQVDQIDSTTLALLARLKRKLSQLHISLSFAKLNKTIRALFKTTLLDRIFKIV